MRACLALMDYSDAYATSSESVHSWRSQKNYLELMLAIPGYYREIHKEIFVNHRTQFSGLGISHKNQYTQEMPMLFLPPNDAVPRGLVILHRQRAQATKTGREHTTVSHFLPHSSLNLAGPSSHLGLGWDI
jgi:hypothetical protein